MTATDSRLRRRGNRLRVARELEKEQREAVPGVIGVCGTLKPSTSSTVRKARPRARGSTICTYTKSTWLYCFFQTTLQQKRHNGLWRAGYICKQGLDWCREVSLSLNVIRLVLIGNWWFNCLFLRKLFIINLKKTPQHFYIASPRIVMCKLDFFFFYINQLDMFLYLAYLVSLSLCLQ